MEITFRTRKLEKEYRASARAVKAYGEKVASKYIQRINIIKSVRNIDELMVLPALGCHSLKGDRRGQYSIKLTGFYRLIFTLKDDALEIKMVKETEKELFFDVSYCGYAEIYEKLGVKKLGCTLSCIRDFYFLEGFNPRITLKRTKTIMEGDDYCDFRYVEE